MDDNRDHPCNVCPIADRGDICDYSCIFHYIDDNGCNNDECEFEHDGICTLGINPEKCFARKQIK